MSNKVYMIYFIGIDPGLNGAVAVIHGVNAEKIEIFDTPTYEKMIKHKKKKKGKYQTKNDYNKKEMSRILSLYKDKDVIICLESVHAMPGQGSVSMFGFGRGSGLWEGIIAAYEYNLMTPTPTEWKKEWENVLIQKVTKKKKISIEEYNKLSYADRVKVDQEEKQRSKEKREAKEGAKKAARELASSLYPNLSDQFLLVKSDGRAESLLMAERLRRMYNRGDFSCQIKETKI